MKLLESKIRKNGFEYTLVKQSESVSMYRQNVSKHVVRYEVFKRLFKREKCIDGIVIPAYERFPSNNDFGVTAWACWNLEKANLKFNQLNNGKIT